MKKLLERIFPSMGCAIMKVNIVLTAKHAMETLFSCAVSQSKGFLAKEESKLPSVLPACSESLLW